MKIKFEESLPDYEQYKNMSYVILGPKENSKKTPLKKSKKAQKENYYTEPEKSNKGIILNNTLFEPNIIKNLRALYKQYSEKFSFICDQILKDKYKQINKNIYRFCVTPFSNNNGMMGSLILNTDQNKQEFNQQLSEYIKRKASKHGDNFDLDSPFHYLFPKNFNALDKLFALLKIDGDDIIEKKSEQLIRIIFIYDIQSVNSVVFNIFIARMMEYNRRQFPKYNYVIIFDVAYDPKNLYDKFNVSFLSKIQFFTIANTPSNCLYHEILYNFIYKKNTGFYIPKSESIKEVLNSIELHQISIESFKHYFNLILFQFFFMHQWNDDEYLLYMDELSEKKINKEIESKDNIINENTNTNKEKKNQKKKSIDNDNNQNAIDNKRKEILEKKLNEIYTSSSELKDLTKHHNILSSNINSEAEKLLGNYNEKMKNWKIFKLFYKLFEGFITEYTPENKEGKNNIYNFLYNFLQYDSSSKFEEIIKKRASAIREIFESISNQIEALKKYFYPEYIKTVKEVDILLNNEDKDKDLLKKLSDDLDNFIKSLDHINLEKVSSVSDNFIIWVSKLLKLICFKKINEADNEALKENSKRKYVNVYRRYLEYKYMIEPPLMSTFLQDLFYYATDDEKNKALIEQNNFDFKNILRAYFKCLMNLDSNFKLNHFFYDFLIEFKITEINDKNKDLVEKYKKVFLVLSYWFNLVGVFQKRKGKKQGFIKNYYSKVNYFEESKEKNK